MSVYLAFCLLIYCFLHYLFRQGLTELEAWHFSWTDGGLQVFRICLSEHFSNVVTSVVRGAIYASYVGAGYLNLSPIESSPQLPTSLHNILIL